MSASASRRKRTAPAPTPTTTPQSNVISSLLESYEFLAYNEYSEKTIGIQAFLLRKSVGDINFSDIIDDSEKRGRQGQTLNCVEILEEKRRCLLEIDASVEKCLILNRLISWIQENESRFTSLLSDIRLNIQLNMTDAQSSPSTLDFRQRENDFNARKHAQEIRRLFYHSHVDARKPQNLVYLQNRTTEQLKYITEQMPRDSKSRQALSKELETILRTSFMIVAQPHSGTSPVTIYERRGPGEYTAKVAVTIICLLHDFMQLNPNLIELYDIEPSLCPVSPFYKLEEPRTISWRRCQIQTAVGGKPRTFLCAELSAITIEQASKTDTRVRFAQLLHSFIFAIKLQFNLADNSKGPVYQFSLDSLPFGIGAHNNQIPQLLTRVLLDDIRRFNPGPSVDVKVIQTYIQRYFIHRTGVRPSECVNVYLEQELNKAITQRNTFGSLEDIYLDFLANFVYQVEFMVKHPILSMFHADGLFLSICNSERAAEAIVQSAVLGSPVIGLRFNSIRVDYNAIATLATGGRAIKFPTCAVRVDIYNDRTKKLQNRTFDSSMLATDISKFVSSTHTENAGLIRILSNFDDRANGKNYLPFKEFAKYYHPRLQEISKNDEKYRLVTDLVDNATDGNTEEDVVDNMSDMSPLGPNSVGSILPVPSNLFENEQSCDGQNSQGYMSAPYDGSGHVTPSSQNILTPPTQLQQPSAPIPYVNDPTAVLEFVLSQPTLVAQIVRRFGNGASNTAAPGELPQAQYQMPPSPYGPRVPMQIPQQRTVSSASFQPMYQQAPAQMYHPSQMQFQTSMPQSYVSQYRQQEPFPQRAASPSTIHYISNNSNQATFVPQTQQFPVFQTNGAEQIPPQFLERMDFWTLAEEKVPQTATDPVQQPTTTNQIPLTIDDSDLQQLLDPVLEQMLAEFTNSQAAENST